MRASAALAVVLFAVACARLDVVQPADYSPEYAEEVVSTGYGYITDRYIETTSIREVALNGIRGLGDIDPDVTVIETSNEAEIYVGFTLAARLPLPSRADAEEWGYLTVAAIEATRVLSPLIGKSDSEQLFKVVFDSALSDLDEFSRYAGREAAEDARALRDGFGGIGITLRMDANDAEIRTVVEQGPAAREGLAIADRITHVDDQPIAGWTQRQLIRTIRGPVGKVVRITAFRPQTGETFSVDLERHRIVLPTVAASSKDGVLILKVTSFNQDTAHSLGQAVRDGRRQMAGALRGIVLDLRGNPGGLLDQAISVADVFLDEGEIVETRGRHPHSIQKFTATGVDMAEGAPLVVLVNGTSASASELVAAALQDLGRAVLIGTNSFGKGTVQTVMRLPNDGELTLTWSRLHAPSGYRLHGLGVLPTLCTHGGGRRYSGLLANLRAGATSTTAALREWRATDTDDVEVLDRLRAICRPDGTAPEIDLELAEALIAEPALYQNAVRLAITAVAER